MVSTTNEKEAFRSDYKRAKYSLGNVTKMVVAVKLPTGATELIINSEQIDSKLEYYLNTYDDDLRLKNNSDVRIVSYLFA